MTKKAVITFDDAESMDFGELIESFLSWNDLDTLTLEDAEDALPEGWTADQRREIAELIIYYNENELWLSIDEEAIEIATTSSIGGFDICLASESRSGHRREWYIAKDSRAAGEGAREYWESLAQNDPDEFAAMVGTDALVSWALGRHARPGCEQTRSLDDWLDVYAKYPEEHYAGYDGAEVDIEGASLGLIDDIGFTPTVAYRNH